MDPVQQNLTLAIDSLCLPRVFGRAIVAHLKARPKIVDFPHYERYPFTILSLSPERVYVIFKKKANEAIIDKGKQSSVALAIDCQSGQRKVYYRTPLMRPKDIAFEKNEIKVREAIKGLEGVLHFEAVHYYTSLHNRKKRGAIAPYYHRGDLFHAVVNDRLNDSQKERILRVLLNTLAKLHALNVIHRDLKPENVLLTDEGSPIICDFGMATLNDKNPEAFSVMCGSPNYAPPENFKIFSVGPYNDVWSMGMLFYVILKENLPWDIPNIDSIDDVYYCKMPYVRYNLNKNNIYEDVTRRMLTYDYKLRPKAEELVITGQQ